MCSSSLCKVSSSRGVPRDSDVKKLFMGFSYAGSNVSSSVLSFSEVVFVHYLYIFTCSFVFSFDSTLVLFHMEVQSEDLLLVMCGNGRSEVLQHLPTIFMSTEEGTFGSFFHSLQWVSVGK